jgi:uridine kinase
MQKRPYLVGITGGSASGKTSFIRSLTEAFPPGRLSVISQDNYYRPAELHQLDESGQINYDLPECIDFESFAADMQDLKQHRVVRKKEYLFQLTDREPGWIELHPAPILVIEGLFIFYYEQIFRELDLKIFIDAADDVKLSRRIRRDTSERGIPREQVIYQWTNHVLPAYEKYLLPFKNAADIVINNNEHFLTSLQVIKDHFSQLPRK